MGKGANRLELIAQQNELLREQNELLREQNELLRRNVDGREIFIEDIDRDEMRNGFLVTSHRKKLWNAQIGLINELARICRKYNLRWFAIGGTLLGAARHKGFIPWDDDVDVVMFRPDYSKFQAVAAKEIKPPYFLDVWCEYSLESESKNAAENLQAVTLEEEKDREKGWRLEWPKMKLRDSRTCMILRPTLSSTNQGIWIDIFPFDPAPPFANKQQAITFNMAKELHMAAMFPAWVDNALSKKAKFVISRDDLRKFISKPLHVRGRYLDKFMAEKFFTSQKAGRVVEQFLQKKIITYSTADFDEIKYLPFEKIEVPAPAGYESVLTANYGDWRELIKYPAHILDYSADISSEEYFKTRSSKEVVSVNDKFELPTDSTS